MDSAGWNRGLMLAALLIVIAGMKMVAAVTRRHRLIAVGMAMQAIVLAFVFNGMFYQRPELPSVAVALVAVLGLWCQMSGEEHAEEDSSFSQQPSVVGVRESTHSQVDSTDAAGGE